MNSNQMPTKNNAPEPNHKPKSLPRKTSADDEIEAMKLISAAIKNLPDASKIRALRWVVDAHELYLGDGS